MIKINKKYFTSKYKLIKDNKLFILFYNQKNYE